MITPSTLPLVSGGGDAQVNLTIFLPRSNDSCIILSRRIRCGRLRLVWHCNDAGHGGFQCSQGCKWQRHRVRSEFCAWYCAVSRDISRHVHDIRLHENMITVHLSSSLVTLLLVHTLLGSQSNVSLPSDGRVCHPATPYYRI